jgi:predicted transcriptional regulator with HTH domain
MKSWYGIKYFGAVKGLNVNELMENGKLIIIGTPEPNIVGYLEDVRIWYQGEKLIENDRIKEPMWSEFYGHDYRYKDSRYMAHVRMKREHELEHTIERVRFIFPDVKKLVVLWSMLPISFRADKMTSKEFVEKYVPGYKTQRSPFVIALSYIRKNNPTRSQFSQVSGNWKCTVQAGGRKKFRELLIRLGFVKEVNSGTTKRLQLTEKGLEYYEHNK